MFVPKGHGFSQPVVQRQEGPTKYDVDYSRFDRLVDSDDDGSDTERQALAPSLGKRLRQPARRRAAKEDPEELLRELETRVSELSATEAVSAARRAEREIAELKLKSEEARAALTEARATAAEAREGVAKARRDAEDRAADLATAREDADRATREARGALEEMALETSLTAPPKIAEATIVDGGVRLRLENVVPGTNVEIAEVGSSDCDCAAATTLREVDGLVGGGLHVEVDPAVTSSLSLARKKCQIRRKEDGAVAREGLAFGGGKDGKDEDNDVTVATVAVREDAYGQSRRARVAVDHLPGIRCFHVAVTFLASEDGWTALERLEFPGGPYVDVVCALGRRFRAKFPVADFDEARCRVVDASTARLAYSRLERATVTTGFSIPHSDVVEVAYPADASRAAYFPTTPDVRVVGCGSCGSGLFSGAASFQRPRRPPSDEAVTLERSDPNDDDSATPRPGEPVECPRTLRARFADVDVATAGGSWTFPPRFLVVTAGDRKARTAKCRRCDADLGLAFFESGGPALVALYKHRLRDAAPCSAVAFVTGLLVDEARLGLTNLLLRGASSTALAVRVLAMDGHAAKQGDVDLDQPQNNAKALPLLPTLKVAFHEEEEEHPCQGDATVVDLHPQDLAAFRDELRKRESTAFLAPGWRVVSLFRQ